MLHRSMLYSCDKYDNEAERCENTCLKSDLDKEVGGIRVTDYSKRCHFLYEALCSDADTDGNMVGHKSYALVPEIKKIACRNNRGAVGEDYVKNTVGQEQDSNRYYKQNG